MAPLNVLSFGASRNIGYFSAVCLLEKGATVTFLLRSPSAFDGDATIQQYIRSGHARLVKGDASNEADTQRAWTEAGVVDAVIFSVGTIPTFSVTKGFIQTPANLVTQCFLNVLCIIPEYTDAPQPKIIVISSTGLTPFAHKSLPVLLKPLYGVAWDSKADGAVAEDILGGGWTRRKGLPAAGSLRRMLVVRPALLTDGKCVADEVEAKGKDKLPYRVSGQELGG
ncbi:hypothetical protein DFH08DRAFT_1007441 [Mycena albidolilacea]|uniref:NAD(P)-binding domain-containing protein n=1 Tax=Mycena albidolilacea TaxID=1033008 RepID=A0AAD7A188_9AGAR|nr:hypothetical protein DFH08DRAFT_1007441 [Mycena albidolilacea]